MLALTAIGCSGPSGYDRSGLDQQMFGPASLRLHPTFTQVRDVSDKGKIDGIEATLEVVDKFGESTRSTGQLLFELCAYQKEANIRGVRVAGPWPAELDTREDQEKYWNAALRAYTFKLSYPLVKRDRYYVLTAQLDLNPAMATTPPRHAGEISERRSAGRLFASLIIEPQIDEKGNDIKRRAPTGTPGR